MYYVNGCRRGLSDDAGGGTQYRLHAADRHVDDVSCRQHHGGFFSVHDLLVGDWNLNHGAVSVLLDDAESTDLCLKRQTLGQRDCLCNVEFTLLLHGVTTRAIHGSEDIDDACPFHDDRVARMYHHIANFTGVATSGVVVRLCRRIPVGALHFDYVAGKLGFTARHSDNFEKAVRREQLYFARHLYLSDNRRGCGCALLHIDADLRILQNSLILACFLQCFLGLNTSIPANMNRLEERYVDVALAVDASRARKVRLIVEEEFSKAPRGCVEAGDT